METVSNIAVAAAEIAAVGQQKFEVSQRRNRRLVDELFFLKGRGGPVNEIFRKAILNELFVLFPDNGFFSLTAPEEKMVGVLAEFVEFIVLDVVEIRLLEILQGAVRANHDEFIPGWRRGLVQG
jgi:hypothetical protein